MLFISKIGKIKKTHFFFRTTHLLMDKKTQQIVSRHSQKITHLYEPLNLTLFFAPWDWNIYLHLPSI